MEENGKDSVAHAVALTCDDRGVNVTQGSFGREVFVSQVMHVMI